MNFIFFFSSRRRHTSLTCDWSSDVCSSDLLLRSRGARLAPQSPLLRVGIAEVAALVEEATAEPIERREIVRRQELADLFARSEERRVGKECTARGLECYDKKKT